jgi:hypothetical protein
MMIVGFDFHPRWQQVSWPDTETGETGECKLVHASGDAQQFYQQLAPLAHYPTQGCMLYVRWEAKWES